MNVATSEPEQLKALHARMRAQRREVSATVPTERESKYGAEMKSPDEPGFRELTVDPTFWKNVEREFEGAAQRLEEAALWTRAEHLAALHDAVFEGDEEDEVPFALDRALRARQDWTDTALVALLERQDLWEDLEDGGPLERASSLFSDAPPPEAVGALQRFVRSKDEWERASAAFVIGKVGSLEAIQVLSTLATTPNEHDFVMGLVGLQYPAGKGQLSARAGDALFELLRGAVPLMEENTFDALTLMLDVDQTRAVAELAGDDALQPGSPRLHDVLRALAVHEVELDHARLLALLESLDPLRDAYPHTNSIQWTLTVLGQHGRASDRTLFERWMNDEDHWIVEGTAKALAASYGLRDWQEQLLDDEDHGTDRSIEAKYVHAVWLLDAEVKNGGFHQYFVNSSGDDWKTALAGLKALGLKRKAKILRASAKRFGWGGPPTDRGQRIDQMAKLAGGEGDDLDFDKQDERWYESPENVTPALVRYVVGNREALGL